MYIVKINNMKFHSHIGVYLEEKTIGQNIEIDIELFLNKFPKNDNIKETISYGEIYRLIEKIVLISRVNLVETLIAQIIENIKEKYHFRLSKVKVSLRKLAVPIDGIFDSVEIVREIEL